MVRENVADVTEHSHLLKAKNSLSLAIALLCSQTITANMRLIKTTSCNTTQKFYICISFQFYYYLKRRGVYKNCRIISSLFCLQIYLLLNTNNLHTQYMHTIIQFFPATYFSGRQPSSRNNTNILSLIKYYACVDLKYIVSW